MIGLREIPDKGFSHRNIFFAPLLCHCEKGQSPDAAIQRNHPATSASPGHPAQRLRLDCHATMRLAMTAFGDASLNRETNHPARSRPPFVIVRRGKTPTRQSSGTIRQPPHRPGIPHNASDWIAAVATLPRNDNAKMCGLPRPDGLAMTESV